MRAAAGANARQRHRLTIHRELQRADAPHRIFSARRSRHHDRRPIIGWLQRRGHVEGRVHGVIHKGQQGSLLAPGNRRVRRRLEKRVLVRPCGGDSLHVISLVRRLGIACRRGDQTDDQQGRKGRKGGRGRKGRKGGRGRKGGKGSRGTKGRKGGKGGTVIACVHISILLALPFPALPVLPASCPSRPPAPPAFPPLPPFRPSRPSRLPAPPAFPARPASLAPPALPRRDIRRAIRCRPRAAAARRRC